MEGNGEESRRTSGGKWGEGVEEEMEGRGWERRKGLVPDLKFWKHPWYKVLFKTTNSLRNLFDLKSGLSGCRGVRRIATNLSGQVLKLHAVQCVICNFAFLCIVFSSTFLPCSTGVINICHISFCWGIRDQRKPSYL